MNLSLLDPFALAQDYPESLTANFRSGHSTCIRFNPKGDLIASGRHDGTIVLFDVETHGLARILRGHVRQIQSLNWSHDGRYLLSCSLDFKAIIWDLLKNGNEAQRTVRFNSPVYGADLHPKRHDMFVTSVFEDQAHFVDISSPKTIKQPLPTLPKRGTAKGSEEGELTEKQAEKQAAQDAKHVTTASVFTSSGDYIITGTSKGWLNLISVRTFEIVYSTRITGGCITYLRLTPSGRNMAVNANDRIIRSVHVPDEVLRGDPADLDLEAAEITVEHKFQDVVNRLLWNNVTISCNADYICASTYHNHDIYVWERSNGVLVKILEGPREELGTVEWHPLRPLVSAVGLETGRIYIWGTSNPQRWSALAPDFRELEENVEYEEREDEFDVHEIEDVKKRRRHLETEDVNILTIEPVRGEVEGLSLPVVLDLDNSESEEEVRIEGPGHFRKKSPGGRASGANANGGGGSSTRSKRKRVE